MNMVSAYRYAISICHSMLSNQQCITLNICLPKHEITMLYDQYTNICCKIWIFTKHKTILQLIIIKQCLYRYFWRKKLIDVFSIGNNEKIRNLFFTSHLSRQAFVSFWKKKKLLCWNIDCAQKKFLYTALTMIYIWAAKNNYENRFQRKVSL